MATGKIQPLTKVQVKSKASGIVKELHVDYGDRVKEGQVLVELDKEELLEAQRARGARGPAAAQAACERNEVEARPGPALPEAALERSRKLYADGLIATSMLEDADKAYQMGLNQQTRRAEQRRGQPGGGRAGPGDARAGRDGPAGTPRSRARWTASCCRATSRWATR